MSENSDELAKGSGSGRVTWLAAGLPLTGRQFHTILNDLEEIAESSADGSVGLVTDSVYLTLFLRFLRDFRMEQKAPWDEAPELNDGALVAFRRIMRGGAQPWDWLRGLAARPVRAGKLRRAILKFARSARAIASGGDSRFVGETRGMWAYLRGTIGGAPAAPPLDPAAWDFVRGRLRAELDVWRAAPPLYLRFAFQCFVLRVALAQELARERHVEIGVAWAEIERDFGPDSGFLLGLGKYPKLKTLLEGLMERSHYPYAMAGE